jgi:chemotaxis signal transduction protein
MSNGKQLEPIPPNSAAGDAAGANDSMDQLLGASQFCVFRAGRERFCLEVLEVEEVVEWPLVTRIPLTPPFLMGVFNLRGSIVPVVDIAITEGRRPGLSPRNVVVASVTGDVQAENIRIGIAADEVIGTYQVGKDSLLEHSPEDLRHCSGMLQHEDRLALIVDMNRLIQSFPIPAI